MTPDSDKVAVAYCHGQHVDAAFTRSLADLLAFDSRHHRRIVEGGRLIDEWSSVNVSGARNRVVRQFLTASDASWLLTSDVDQCFAADSLERLLAAADPVKAPVVSGLAFALADGVVMPCCFDLVGEPPMLMRPVDIPDNTMRQVAAVGAGFLLMHREALVRVAKTSGDDVFPWFRESTLYGQPAGEDVVFSLRLAAAGIPVFVHTGVQIGHVKPHLVDLDLYRAQSALNNTKPEESA